jgi:hypothetical protein
MKTKLSLVAVALIAAGTMFAQPRVSIGIGVGGYGPGYYPPPVYAPQYAPPCPGPGYAWVDGYWAPQGGRNVWIGGFWRSPYDGRNRWAPRYDLPRFYNSYGGYDLGYGNRGYENRGRQHSSDRGRGYGRGFRR